mmetsp:Transcript_11332/g.10257  ORF Transcript_11332/g.10257 Transcript_11332/m.10257 type:complete len:188 (-) Transcript_11332:31-594(-)
MSMARSSRMLHYINYRMRYTLSDSRVLVGTFMAFDRHMNLVVSDAEEYRIIKTKKGQGLNEEKYEKRALGLIILRGDTIVSMTIEGPPPPDNDEKLTPGGPGIAKAAGRGLPIAPVGQAISGPPVGLAGPIRGVGGPMPSMMVPPGGMPRPPGFAGQPPGLPLPPPPMMPRGLAPPPMPPGMFAPRG